MKKNFVSSFYGCPGNKERKQNAKHSTLKNENTKNIEPVKLSILATVILSKILDSNRLHDMLLQNKCDCALTETNKNQGKRKSQRPQII